MTHPTSSGIRVRMSFPGRRRRRGRGADLSNFRIWVRTGPKSPGEKREMVLNLLNTGICVHTMPLPSISVICETDEEEDEEEVLQNIENATVSMRHET